jgi:hypothetical protein
LGSVTCALAHRDEQPLHLEDLLQLVVVGVQEDAVLKLVDPVIEGGEAWEEAVDEPVDDAVEQQRRLCGFDSGCRFDQAGPMRSDLHLGATWDPFAASAICAQEPAALVLSGCGRECVDIQGHVVDTGPECCEFAAARDEDAAVELKRQCAVGGQPVGRLIDQAPVRPRPSPTAGSAFRQTRWRLTSH